MKEIKLTKGKFALVDDLDYEWLNSLKWYAYKSKNSCWYAAGRERGTQKSISMHRHILGLTGKGTEVDHKNLNGLDNQRHNLRLCTRGQNQHHQPKHGGTTSQYKGVSWDKNRGRWIAQITINSEHRFLGRYDLEIDAALAYDVAARELYPLFALTNF